jgi:hypothetical protein
MVLSKRYCVTYDDGQIQCYDDDSFWYTDVRLTHPFTLSPLDTK